MADTSITADKPNEPAPSSVLTVKTDGRYLSLARFDLRDYAWLSNKTIYSATLELYAFDRDKLWSCLVGLYRLRRPWVTEQATWMNASVGQPWSLPGAAGPDDRDASPLVEAEVSAANAWYRFDVTNAVRDWLAEPEANYGVLLKSSGTNAVIYKFAQAEYTGQSYRPRLVIVYSGPAVTPSATATAPAPTPTETPSGPTPTPTATVPALTLQQGTAGYLGAADTYITTDSGAPHASDGKLIVKGDGNGSYSSLIRFDLSQLSGRTIHAATLEIHTVYRDKSTSCLVGMYRLRRPWIASQATWFNAANAQLWSGPGASGPDDRDAAPLAEQQVSSASAWYRFDVTDAMRDWVAHADSNYGVLIRSAACLSAVYHFASSDYSVRDWRPKLVIYASAATPGAAPGGAEAPGIQRQAVRWWDYCRRCPE